MLAQCLSQLACQIEQETAGAALVANLDSRGVDQASPPAASLSLTRADVLTSMSLPERGHDDSSSRIRPGTAGAAP